MCITTPWVEQLVGKRVSRDERKQAKTFHRLRMLLMTDDTFKAEVGYAEGYMACVKVNCTGRVENSNPKRKN